MPDYTVSGDVDSMLRSDNDAAIRSAIGVGTTDAPTFLAQTLTGQSLTGTQATSLVDLNATWNTTGNPSLIYGRVTNTNSGTTANLIDLGTFAGGAVFKVDKGGVATLTGLASSLVVAYPAQSQTLLWQKGLANNSRSAITWSNIDSNYSPVDLSIRRESVGVLAQYYLSVPQSLRVYNTAFATTEGAPTNYERGVFDWKTTTNTLRIGTEHLGSGQARPIEFVTGGVVRMTIAAAGTTNFTGAASFNSSITCGSDFYGQQDVYCASGRYFRFSGFGDVTALSCGAAGVMTFEDISGGNVTPRITLGGKTSAYPAIKRNGTGIDIRLADDSAFAPISSLYQRFGSGTPEGAVTAPTGAVFHRTDGTSGSSFYVKESGSGANGWVAK